MLLSDRPDRNETRSIGFTHRVRMGSRGGQLPKLRAQGTSAASITRFTETLRHRCSGQGVESRPDFPVVAAVMISR
jgi:hypothetical protein